MIRAAYDRAAHMFVDTVAQVQAEQWQQAGLGVWTVRDLVGHTSRALLTVESYLATPAAQIDAARPVDYFVRAMAGLADPAAVAARGREAGQALGDDPIGTVQTIAARVLARVQTAADDTLVQTPVGGMRLIDYLPSRIFELVVHTLDLSAALHRPVTVPPDAAAVATRLLADMAVESGKAASLLLAATGRQPFPEGFSVL